MVTTRIETAPEYAIDGVVVDRATQRGVRGVRVEAWDRDTRYHDLLGQVITDDDGAFTIGYDSVYFGDYGEDRSPDVFFKVYLDGREVLNTFERTTMNVQRGRLAVRLELELATLQPTHADRIGVETTMKAVAWWRASDFRGLADEGRAKFGTVGSMFASVLGDKAAGWDFAPVAPTATRENQIVGQNAQQAQSTLAQAQVQVAEVRSVGQAGSDTGLRSLADYPLVLNANDRVTLYTENGVVRYYTRVPATDAASVDAQTVARLDADVQTLKTQAVQVDGLRGDVQSLRSADAAVDERLSQETDTSRAQAEELQRLNAELADVRAAAAAKDVQIAQLTSDLKVVRTDTDNLARRIPVERLQALEERLNQIDPALLRVAPTVASTAPAAAAASAPTPAAPVKPKRAGATAAKKSGNTD